MFHNQICPVQIAESGATESNGSIQFLNHFSKFNNKQFRIWVGSEPRQHWYVHIQCDTREMPFIEAVVNSTNNLHF
jgi:hypothetical protein